MSTKAKTKASGKPVSTQDTNFDDIMSTMPLLTIGEKGEVPASRLSKPADLRSMYRRLYDDDDINRANRAETNLLLFGDPPYQDSEIKEAGMGEITNLNFGGAEQQLERAMAPFYRIIQSPENLVSVNTLYGAKENRSEYNAILSEEITRTIRECETFPFHTARLIHKFVWDGLAVAHWPDELDWRYRGTGLDQFYFPRQVYASESEMEFACCVEEYTVTRLFKSIEDCDIACKAGWNVTAVRDAIRSATSGEPRYTDWERLADEMKNNDLSVANNNPVVRVINGFVKEFDGTVAHYIITEDPCGSQGGQSGERFLYCSRQKYASMREAFVMFPYGIGTNTKAHSIRGLGFKIFAFEQQRNRSLGRLIDQSTLASSFIVQATDEEALANMGIQQWGNTVVVNPDCKVVQYTPTDLSRSVMPALNEMERLRNDRVSGYSADNAFDGDRKTKYEVSAQLQQSAALSDITLDFFYAPLERLLQQTIRRMIRRNMVPQDPGGREIADMCLRLVRRGVPLEALYQIDVKAVKVVRAIGAGSAAAKTLALTRISELRGRMDDVAQATLDRELAVDAVGTAAADQYFPRLENPRQTLDTSLAVLQNAMLLAGQEVPVLSHEKHLAHAREHVKPLMEMFQLVEGGQMPIEEGAMQYRLLYQHASEHVDRISGDPNAMQEAAMFRQVLQQIGEVISNGLKKAQAAQAKAEEEGPVEGQQAPAGPDAKQMAEFERHRMKMEQAQEMYELKKAQMLDMAATKKQIADAEAAARIRGETGPTQ